MFSLHMMSDLEPFFLMIYSLIVDNIHLLTSGAVDALTNIAQSDITEITNSSTSWEFNAFIKTPMSASSLMDTDPNDPMPGVRCPKCAGRGLETWVLPGKHCPKCGHPC